MAEDLHRPEPVPAEDRGRTVIADRVVQRIAAARPNSVALARHDLRSAADPPAALADLVGGTLDGRNGGADQQSGQSAMGSLSS